MSIHVIIVLLLVQSTVGLYIIVDSQPVCFELEKATGKQYKFNYEVNGQEPENIELTVERSVAALELSEPRPSQDDPDWQRRLYTGARQNLQLDGQYGLRLCFRSTDRADKPISILFYTEDQAHFMALAKKSELMDLFIDISKAGLKMRDIVEVEHFSEQRQVKQAEALSNHEQTVKKYAWIKIIIVVLAAVVQLVVLKRILSQKYQGYQTV